MIGISITGIEDCRAMMDAVAARVADMTPAMEVIGLNLNRSVQKRFQTGNNWPQSLRAMREGGRTMLQTGRLRMSIGSGAGDGSAQEVTALSVMIGTNTTYARLMQEGGTVSAQKGALAIPITKEARRAAATVASIREIPGLSFVPRKGKPPLLVKTLERGSKAKGTKKGDLEPWFVLKKSITVRARPFLYFEEGDIPMIERVIARHIKGAANADGGAGD